MTYAFRAGHRTGAGVRLLAAAGTVALALAACSSASTTVPPQRSDDNNVSFHGCQPAACTGTLDGAKYEIDMPKHWNGTLLIYSHGYREAQPIPPDFAPVDTTAEPAPGWSSNQQQVGLALLDQGYAIAGSSYKTNGWAVADGVRADEELHQYFVDKVAKPDRTIVWGDSLGGLITEVVSEKHPEWVDGAIPLCGVLAGPNKNLDLALDVAYAIKTLIYPQLKLTGYSSYNEAVANWEGAAKAIVAAGADTAHGVPKILLVAALAGAPSQTATYDGSTITSQVEAYAESVLTALGYGTFGRFEIEQRIGGNPSQNTGVDYSTRISAAQRSLIDTVSPGATDTLLAELAAGQRVSADQAARDKLAATGTPTGDIVRPTLTFHTKSDPLVLSQNETVFASEVQANPKANGDLVQLYTVPPATYPTTVGAPYGAGHCNFTAVSRLAAVALMQNWVRNGVYPGTAAIADAMGTASGYDPVYRPGPWPAGS
jgi:pimeloyl-ACP methyl ester carboxylesterase